MGNPVPVIAGATPCGTYAGAAGFTVTLSGQNFLSGSTVTFNGMSASVTNSSATSLSFSVTSAMIATAPAGNQVAIVVTNPSPGGGASAPLQFGLASQQVTIATVQSAIFTPSCATAGCHTAMTRAGNLELVAGVSASQLVGVTSSACAPEKRVTACVPTRAASVLIDKVLASASSPPCSGTKMPKAGSITAAQQQQIVDWVAQGAP